MVRSLGSLRTLGALRSVCGWDEGGVGDDTRAGCPRSDSGCFFVFGAKIGGGGGGWCANLHFCVGIFL